MDLHKIASNLTKEVVAAYSLGGVSSEQIIAELKKIHNPEAKKWMESIQEIEKKGIRYSNQDFDILSGAKNFLHKHGVDFKK